MSTPSPDSSPPSVISPLASRQDLEMEAAALLELDARRHRAPLYYFHPHKVQEEFFASSARIRIFVGGNRSGKTEGLVGYICSSALGYSPWKLRESGMPCPSPIWERPHNCPPAALALSTANIRIQIPSTVLVISALPALSGIGEILFPKIKRYLGDAMKSFRRGHGGVPCEVELHNGSRIIFITAHSESMSFEGTAVDAVAFDEPPPRAIWTGVRRSTVDRCAPIALAFTPIGSNAAWLFHDLVSTADGQTVSVHSCSIFDNPFLSDDQRSALVTDPVMTEAEREARLYGRFISLSDCIYPTFDPKVHVVEDFLPLPAWPCFEIIDPHQVKPWAIAICAVSPNRDIYFFREWPSEPFHKLRRDTRNLESYALLLRQIEGNLPIVTRLIDPNMGPRNDCIKGIHIPSFVEELGKYGIDTYHSFSDSLEIGEALVRRRLAFDPAKPLGPYNRPSLFVTRSCHNLINSLSYYAAKNKPGTFNDPMEGKRDETFKDFADLIRYACVSQIADSMDTSFSTPSAPLPSVLSYLD
jgi:hypothetical protein